MYSPPKEAGFYVEVKRKADRKILLTFSEGTNYSEAKTTYTDVCKTLEKTKHTCSLYEIKYSPDGKQTQVIHEATI